MSTAETSAEIEWVVSSSPHLHDTESTARIMWSVAASLVPAGAWGVYVFGLPAVYVMVMCVGTCVLTEMVVQRMRGHRSTVSDGSAVVTGLLLAYVLPSQSVVMRTIPGGGQVAELAWLQWQVPVIGSVVAIAVAKHCFGGLGHNIWNPALVGRAFVQLAFAGHVSLAQWPWPMGLRAGAPSVDAVTRATALASSGGTYSVKALFFGMCPGCIGEISAFLLLLGALFLIVRRYVNWRLPLGYLGALVVLATLFAWAPRESMVPWVSAFAERFSALRSGRIGLGTFSGDWLTFAGRQLFSGGVILGAFFMATDMVTSPLSSKGQFVFGVGCGVLTALIRFYSGYPEGVCYSILLMNTVRPYIDRATRPRLLGEQKE